MNRPEIQIIIPVYNGEKYLQACLDSVKNQSFANWQALVIDDASSDGSADIVRSYAAEDARFVLVQQERNGGVSRARNRALELLNAEYTAFLDADDYWERETLQTMLDAARNQNCDIVQCRFIYDFSSGRQIAPAGAFQRDTLLEGRALRRAYIRMMTGINMNHVCMKLIRTELFSGMRFDTEMKTAEDLKMCIDLFRKVRRYYFLDRPFYHYRRSETSLTGKGLSGREKFRANRTISNELLKALPEWGINQPFYRLLSWMRPYTITCSKIFRTIREKLMSH